MPAASCPRPRSAGPVLALALLAALALPVGSAQALAASDGDDASTPALTTPFAVVDDWDVDDRLAQPEDRYALAGGCYAIEAPGAGFVARDGGGLVLVGDRAAAEPFHLQATRAGEYLVATNEGPDEHYAEANWDVRGFLSARSLAPEVALRGTGIPAPGEGLFPEAPLPAGPTTDEVTVAAEPSEIGDWRIEASGSDPEARVNGTQRSGAGSPPRRPPGAGTQRYVLTLPAAGKALSADGDELGLVAAGEAGEFAFHLVPGGEGCARWPEIDTNTSGRPEPAPDGPAGEALGFFEAHVHGMAFEFLGGELRCGRPWHPYGVEYALGDCYEDGNHYNGALEVAVAGKEPTDPVLAYDPVGWPTFSYWPQHRTLTHEQFYWRWLERAHHGGLRLVTNLLVDNTALCQAFPVKRNSCNEMDGVRLQAQRLFELQDYIDAQSGGPGEGWLRIVTSPAQAREVINAGRLAVVLGIEISELFDCREVLDAPQCTAAEIDERLEEVFDMGVRQLQIINKFDNALSGVTGDGGATGVVVNTGNRQITGHWWDMETCEEEPDHEHGLDGHEHDKTQPNPRDDIPGGDSEEIDVLAGTVLELFGTTRGYVAPLYPEGPHCNTRGLTELGEHVIRAMIAKGFIFDPDHMSALAQRQAMDLIEHEIVPDLQAAGSAVKPAVISSHSWANDVVYQRIYGLDGVVAPRTQPADSFVRSWVEHRGWATARAPDGYRFGMGYGADTNGLGGQPAPRSSGDRWVDYDVPFAAPIGEVLIEQQRSGLRTYDVSTDGVAHYGLFADWFHELTLAADEIAAEQGGGDAIIADMLLGAETYLQMWERAVYGGADCVDDRSSLQVEDLHALLGANLEGFLSAAGQPISRDGAAYVYCVENADGEREVVEVTFDDSGIADSVEPGSVGAWLDARRSGAVLDPAHGPDGLPGDEDGEGPAGVVLLLGMGVIAVRLQPARRWGAGHLVLAAPILAALVLSLP